MTEVYFLITFHVHWGVIGTSALPWGFMPASRLKVEPPLGHAILTAKGKEKGVRRNTWQPFKFTLRLVAWPWNGIGTPAEGGTAGYQAKARVGRPLTTGHSSN